MKKSPDEKLEGHGGSTVVGADGSVARTRGTINPGEPGYDEAIARTPVEDEKRKGALNRLPSFADLEEKTPEPAKTGKATAPAPKGDSK